MKERYADGRLARSTVQIYEIIQQNHSIEVRELRKLVGMQDKADKIAFDHALIDLQNTTIRLAQAALGRGCCIVFAKEAFGLIHPHGSLQGIPRDNG